MVALVPDHIPKRSSTERVSIVCILSTSIMTNECWGRKGMMNITGQRLLLGGLRGGREGKVYARVWKLLGALCLRTNVLRQADRLNRSGPEVERAGLMRIADDFFRSI